MFYTTKSKNGFYKPKNCKFGDTWTSKSLRMLICHSQDILIGFEISTFDLLMFYPSTNVCVIADLIGT